MPSPLNLIEAWVYSLFNLMPYLMMAVYPFHDKLRVPRAVYRMAILLVCVIQLGLGTWAAFYPAVSSGIKSVVSTVIYIAFYLAVIKAHPGQMAFTLLIMSNICNTITILAKCTENIFFPELAVQGYRWSFTLMLIAWQLIILIPLWVYFKKIYAPVMAKGESQTIWHFVWCVPLTFYVIWNYVSYHIGESLLEISLDPKNAVFQFAISVGSFIVYHAVIILSKEQQKNHELTIQNHQLELNTLEYKNLMSKVSEIRRMKHDIRHNVVLMNDYLKNGRYDELSAFFAKYLSDLAEMETLVYCDNDTVNTLLSYYAQMARRDGIEFRCSAAIPAELGMSEPDIAVLTGNLLENAVEGCRSSGAEHAEISVAARVENGNSLVIVIENTCRAEPKADGKGVLYSTKHSGLGIGVQSVGSIVEKYGGVMKKEYADGKYRVSMMFLMK